MRKAQPLSALEGAAHMVPHPSSLLDSWVIPDPHKVSPIGGAQTHAQSLVPWSPSPPERGMALARLSVTFAQALLWDDGAALPWNASHGSAWQS